MPHQIFSKINLNPHPFTLKRHVSESPALYSSHTMKTFAESLTGLYIPLFILTLPNAWTITGNSLTDGILLILAFYFVRSMFALSFINLITNTIFGYLNFKKSIFFGNVFLAIALAVLSLSNHSLVFLFISSALFAIETSLYWIPYHLFFIRKVSDDDGHYGHTFGMRVLLANLASAGGPIIGGLVITLYGFPLLFLIATLLIIFSSIPVLFSVHERVHGKHSAKHIFERLIQSHSLKNDTLAMGAVEADAILYSIFWPLLIFLVGSSFTQLGIISSVSIAISSLAALVIGNLVDKSGAKFIHKIGCTINAILYLPRVYISSIQAVFILDIVDKLNGILYGVPFNAVMYEHAKARMHDSDFIIYRAIISHLVISVLMMITAILIVIMPSWRYIFVLLAFISPFAYLINKKPK